MGVVAIRGLYRYTVYIGVCVGGGGYQGGGGVVAIRGLGGGEGGVLSGGYIDILYI